MRALVLDFDGVIVNSAPECFEVALRTYADLVPGSRLGARDRDVLYRGFLDLMPLGNRSEDFGVALAALDARLDIGDQAAYDAFHALRPVPWLQSFHARFYEHRAAFAAADPAGWRSLNPPYAEFLALLRRHAGRLGLALATAKDRASVRMLLSSWGAEDLFPEDLVFDKETGESKVAHLGHVRERLGLGFHELTFVDDKVNHLETVSPLGVRCGLAAWGYNGPREHALARARGYLVCRLDDAEAQLFGSGSSPGCP